MTNNNANNKQRVSQDTGTNLAKFTTCAPHIEKTPTDNKTVKKKCLVKDSKTKKCIKRTKLSVKRSVHKDSCLTADALELLVKAWNKENPSQHIVFKSPLAKVWETLRNNIIKHVPLESGEHAWLEQDWVYKALTAEKAEHIKKDLFRPKAPTEWKTIPTAWLSTVDINKTLKQYETKFPTFRFYGATPIDFELKDSTGSCAISSLCKLDLGTIINSNNTNAAAVAGNNSNNGTSLMSAAEPKIIDFIGAVFNLDKHDEDGSHWVSMFINIPLQEINYWDSFAFKPPVQIRKFMLKLQKQAEAAGKKFKIQCNRKRHQYNLTECGVYSINFIVQQLEGKSFSEVCNNVINDKRMNTMRKNYFNIA